MELNPEKARMLAGAMYLSADPGLEAERLNARRLTRLYNATLEDEPDAGGRSWRNSSGRSARSASSSRRSGAITAR